MIFKLDLREIQRHFDIWGDPDFWMGPIYPPSGEVGSRKVNDIDHL